jgi:choline-sulfatase
LAANITGKTLYGGENEGTMPTMPPNILLIISDQHSPHLLGCAGDPLVRTPHLDALAGRGVRFENAYCACPLCVPSRMAFMTSRHCQDIEVWTNSCTLASDIPTFAHALGAGGYETVLGGRMHFIGPDQRHGFQRRLIGDVTSSMPGGPGPDLGNIPPGSTGQDRIAVEVAGPGRTGYQAYDDAVVEACGDYLRERSTQGGEKPFLLVAGFVLPHCPFIAPKTLYDYYYENMHMPELPEAYFDSLHTVMRGWRERRRIDDLGEEQIRKARAGYYGLVEYFDANVGQLIAGLNAAGLNEDTVVIYVSDHGDSAGENGLWWKSNFYEASAGIPMIISAPGRYPEGISRDEVVSLLDIAPTLADIGDTEPPAEISGESLTPLLSAAPAPGWHNEAISEFTGSVRGDPPGRMIRRGPWKLIQYRGHEPMLFNLDEDPHEFTDRAADRSCRQIRDDLQARVTAGWDPERAEALLARRSRDRAMLAAWRQEWDVLDEDHWYGPAAANVFPEQ